MGIREELQKRIDRKQQEITELELKAREARSYIQALQDSLKLLPKDYSAGGGTETVLRPGSHLYQAREAIRKAGHPLHVNDILKALGKPIEKRSRMSLAGSLSGYARKGGIFSRPAPNTFGLLEMGSASRADENGPPDDFGMR